MAWKHDSNERLLKNASDRYLSGSNSEHGRHEIVLEANLGFVRLFKLGKTKIGFISAT